MEDVNFSRNFSFSGRECVFHILIFCWVSIITTIHVHIQVIQTTTKQEWSWLLKAEADHINDTETQIVWVSVHKIMSSIFATHVTALCAKLCFRYFLSGLSTVDFYLILVSCLNFRFSFSLVGENSKSVRHFRYRYRLRRRKNTGHQCVVPFTELSKLHMWNESKKCTLHWE